MLYSTTKSDNSDLSVEGVYLEMGRILEVSMNNALLAQFPYSSEFRDFGILLQGGMLYTGGRIGVEVLFVKIRRVCGRCSFRISV